MTLNSWENLSDFLGQISLKMAFFYLKNPGFFCKNNPGFGVLKITKNPGFPRSGKPGATTLEKS